MKRRVALLIGQILALVLTLPLVVLAAMYATGNILAAFLAPIVIFAGLMYLIVRPIPRLVAELMADEGTGGNWEE